RRAELDPPGKIAVVAVGEEVAEAELFELLRGEVRLEPEPLLEVVRPDLHARLADLEGGLGDRVRPLFDDQGAQLRRLLPQLARETSAGQAAAEDDDIVVITGHGPSHGASASRSCSSGSSFPAATRPSSRRCAAGARRGATARPIARARESRAGSAPSPSESSGT